MSPDERDFWDRAKRALSTAQLLVDTDPDASVSRAYYAAFYAAAAWFALEGRSYTKHSGVEAAVHRDLVKAGVWSRELGASYSWLVRSRYTADYGGAVHAFRDDAEDAVRRARSILESIRSLAPEEFGQSL